MTLIRILQVPGLNHEKAPESPSVLKCSNRQAEVEHQQLKIVLAADGGPTF